MRRRSKQREGMAADLNVVVAAYDMVCELVNIVSDIKSVFLGRVIGLIHSFRDRAATSSATEIDELTKRFWMNIRAKPHELLQDVFDKLRERVPVQPKV